MVPVCPTAPVGPVAPTEIEIFQVVPSQKAIDWVIELIQISPIDGNGGGPELYVTY
jgi:hypothetical protein